MANLLFHPQTEEQLSRLISNPPHAVLLSGATGSGKLSTANHLAEQVLNVAPGSLEHYPYLTIIRPEGTKAISIDAVRELEHFLALKIPGKQLISRLAIISDAHLLTTEAQNALLKTLEEPPANTMLILTSAHDQALLPTIRSRVQTIAITRPAQTSLHEYLDSAGYQPKQIEQALAMSGGLPGLSVALLAGDEDHPLVQATRIAREILQKPPFERLLLVDSLSKDKEACQQVLFILEQMAHGALLKASTGAMARWSKVLKAAYEAREQLLENGQAKLVLTNLMLSL